MTRHKLRDLLNIKHGYAFEGEHFTSSGSFVLLTPGSFHEAGGFRDQGEKTKYFVGDFPDEYLLNAGDLIVVMTEQVAGLLGASALVPEPGRYLHNQRLGLVVDLDESKLDRQFLYRLFNTRSVRHQIAGTASGTKVRHTSPSRIREVVVDLPDVSTQRRIAAIVSTYDALIENNARRMALLERAARVLYEEWFVRLRFPGYEHTKIINGVPQGWERKPLAECATFLSGGTPSKQRGDFWEGDIPWISSGEMTSARLHDSELKVTAEAVHDGSRLLPANSILAVVRGMSLAKEFRVCTTARPMSFNQDLKAIVPHDGLKPSFLFQSLIAQRDGIRDQATEASHGTKKLDTPVLAKVPILVPTPILRTLYTDQADAANQQWDCLWQQNKRLRQARDLLLPRLMSGQIEV